MLVNSLLLASYYIWILTLLIPIDLFSPNLIIHGWQTKNGIFLEI
jgi:hypothetical protein